VTIRATLSINPKKTAELFNAVAPTEVTGDISTIANEQVYRTYASQIIQAEVREYLSKLSISEIASSNEKINSDLRVQLGKAIESLTPFSVRFVGITNLVPKSSPMLRVRRRAREAIKRRSSVGDFQGAVRARIAGSPSASD
jgi:hypothetical protein